MNALGATSTTLMSADGASAVFSAIAIVIAIVIALVEQRRHNRQIANENAAQERSKTERERLAIIERNNLVESCALVIDDAVLQLRKEARSIYDSGMGYVDWMPDRGIPHLAAPGKIALTALLASARLDHTSILTISRAIRALDNLSNSRHLTTAPSVGAVRNLCEPLFEDLERRAAELRENKLIA